MAWTPHRRRDAARDATCIAHGASCGSSAAPIYPTQHAPDGVVGPEANPRGNGAVLPGLLGQLHLGAERLLRRLQSTPKNQVSTNSHAICARSMRHSGAAASLGQHSTLRPACQGRLLRNLPSVSHSQPSPRASSAHVPSWLWLKRQRPCSVLLPCLVARGSMGRHARVAGMLHDRFPAIIAHETIPAVCPPAPQILSNDM